ncbi:skin secretory protein xP2-like [Manacus candei]|uniref:skin secretory protein xP2-like n=1 Tax=Manacus candei TaxID=415023 RepID=UPI00222610BC|nr:skin secretory protein xP2-like [Manacus candei]
MLQPDAAARVKGGKDRREIVRKCAFIQSLQLSLPRTSPSQPRVGERGRLGCARLGTGTNSSLPCSGRFSGPVRDSPEGCKGARATSELVSRDKGANPARRGPSLRGKGVARVSPPGPACGGASPPGDGRAVPCPSYCQGMEELCPALPFLLPGDGGDVPWSCALHCPSYYQGMEELCPGAVPCTALPIARGWRRCALELCPALPCRRSRRSGAQAMPPAAAGLPAQPVAAGLEQLRASASIGNQMDLSGEQGSSAKRTSQGWEPATGTAVGTDKGLPAAPQPGAALDGPPEMPQRPGHAPAPAQKDPENPAGPRQCRHGGAAEQRGQPFPGPTSQSSPAPPACVPPAPNPCPSSRSPAASSSLKARAMCPQRH